MARAALNDSSTSYLKLCNLARSKAYSVAVPHAGELFTDRHGSVKFFLTVPLLYTDNQINSDVTRCSKVLPKVSTIRSGAVSIVRTILPPLDSPVRNFYLTKRITN